MLLPAQLRQVTWLRPARTPSRPLTKCLSVCVRQRQIATGSSTHEGVPASPARGFFRSLKGGVHRLCQRAASPSLLHLLYALILIAAGLRRAAHALDKPGARPGLVPQCSRRRTGIQRLRDDAEIGAMQDVAAGEFICRPSSGRSSDPRVPAPLRQAVPPAG